MYQMNLISKQSFRFVSTHGSERNNVILEETIKLNEDRNTTGAREVYVRMHMTFFPVMTTTNNSDLKACEKQRKDLLLWSVGMESQSM